MIMIQALSKDSDKTTYFKWIVKKHGVAVSWLYWSKVDDVMRKGFSPASFNFALAKLKHS